MVVHHWSDDGMVLYHRRSLIGNHFWGKGRVEVCYLDLALCYSISKSRDNIAAQKYAENLKYFETYPEEGGKGEVTVQLEGKYWTSNWSHLQTQS